MSEEKTVAINKEQIDLYHQKGPVKLGPWSSDTWRNDPRRLLFILARYKFCAKMLAGKNEVLEVGCGDGLGMQIVLQTVGSVHGVDFEPAIVEDAQRRLGAEGSDRASFSVLDITKGFVDRQFDGAYSLDVIEHIPPAQDNVFMGNICRSLHEHAVCVIGTPNITAAAYASENSRQSHINLKSAENLKVLMSQWFQNVFIFSMNDEVIHTGFHPMAHYLMAVGVGVRQRHG